MNDAHAHTVWRLFDEIWNGRRFESIPELYAEDYVADYRPYGPLRHGHEGIRQMVEGAYATFPDFHEELLDMVVDGSRAAIPPPGLGHAVRHVGTARAHRPASRVRGDDLPHVRRRRPCERAERGVVDNLHALRQAGVVPGPTHIPD